MELYTDMEPVGYVFSDGYSLCSDCCEDYSDPNNETGNAGAIFIWEPEATSLTCDNCGLTLAEGAGYILID